MNGLAQLADCLTKAGERRVFLQFMARGQSWRIIHDEQFTAGRKLKRQLEQAAKEAESLFIEQLKKLALEQRWPWDTDEPRSRGDVRLEGMSDPVEHVDSSVAI